MGIALIWASESDSKRSDSTNITQNLVLQMSLTRKLGNQKAGVPVAGFRVEPL